MRVPASGPPARESAPFGPSRPRPRRPFAARTAALAAAAALAFSLGVVVPAAAAPGKTDAAASPAGCTLAPGNPAVQHVIYLNFDNVHFTRDNPNVPSDLEQMPHLLNFLESNGTLDTNHHTPLIAHTATDILTALTGVYGDRHGVPVANSFRYFKPDGGTSLGVSFAYWTDPIFDPTTSSPTDTTYNMLTAQGLNAPAPWVPYTRAGCAFGGVATANIELENIATDIPTVFGAGSPQAAEVAANPAQATADFVGIAVHCPEGATLCSSANGGEPDVLPDEPGGYSGYQGLFGHKYVAPQIAPGGPLTDLSGNVVQDATGHVGFPGFDGMSASVSLAYVADMQEHGIPVTYAYISDAHDKHPSGPAYGPGEAGYVAALKSYDDAFATFFSRLQSDGITSANTLFVVTSDEVVVLVGGAPSPAGCDGVTVPCTYNQIGELNVNAAGLLATEQGITTPFTVHSDAAPNFYITGNPVRTAAVTRTFEQATAKLTVTNTLTGANEKLFNYLADPVEEKILHMVTADPNRTPTFTGFAKPDYYVYAGAPNCNSACVVEEAAFAWNHGDVSPDINRTWLGLAGPGIRNLGATASVWSDHTDIRPTMMALLGLRDDYRHDGRVLTQFLTAQATPRALRGGAVQELGEAYKQLDAAVGAFGLTSLAVSTVALSSSSAGDHTYLSLENRLATLGARRDRVALEISKALEAAAFRGRSISQGEAQSLTEQADSLIQAMERLASSASH